VTGTTELDGVGLDELVPVALDEPEPVALDEPVPVSLNNRVPVELIRDGNDVLLAEDAVLICASVRPKG